jgi:predicted RNase H-like HicB family nuclease
MEFTFTAVYEEVPLAQGGGYVAYVEEVPGAITQGETLDETRDNLKEALQLMLETNRELLAAPIPPRRILREKISVNA